MYYWESSSIKSALFYHDAKEYHISEHQLVHHALKFGLNADVATRLGSTYNGDDDYILEFFLPSDMKRSTQQQLLINNFSSTMQRVCKSLRTLSDAELLGGDSKVFLQDGKVQKLSPITLSGRSSQQSLINSNLNSCDSDSLKVSDVNRYSYIYIMNLTPFLLDKVAFCVVLYQLSLLLNHLFEDF
ncbi:Protein NLP9 [Forsythia ovata]|uniref:Protein NLP9 n=1 Tax=Forsythia ovata TaxID=205694 RepID=A0ABD1UY50_9LAMI